METTQAIGEGLTFEKVWAALMETRERQEETARITRMNGKYGPPLLKIP
jgi:hypothetical protein